MSFLRWTSGLCLATVLLAFIAGCGEKGPTLLSVKGNVTVDGEPAEGVSLLFHGANTVSTATSDSSGSFTVVTDTKPGMPAGSYKVTASWPEPMKFGSGGMGETPDTPDRLAGKFVSRDQSKISVDVTDSTTELPVIELSTR